MRLLRYVRGADAGIGVRVDAGVVATGYGDWRRGPSAAEIDGKGLTAASGHASHANGSRLALGPAGGVERALFLRGDGTRGNVDFGQGRSTIAPMSASRCVETAGRRSRRRGPKRFGVLGASAPLVVVLMLATAATAWPATVPTTTVFADTRVGEVSQTVTTIVSGAPDAATPEHIDGVQVMGPAANAFTIVGDTCSRQTVTTTCAVTIQFSPLAAGVHTGSLRIDGQFGTVTVALIGLAFAEGPRLEVASEGVITDGPGVLLDPVYTGDMTPPARFRIKNAGDRPTTLTGVSVDAGDRLWARDNCVRRELRPGGHCDVVLRYFAGVSAGPFTALVRVEGDREAAPLDVQVSGNVARRPRPMRSAPAPRPRPSPQGPLDPGWSLRVVSASRRGDRLRLRIFSSRGGRITGSVRSGSRNVARIPVRGLRPGLRTHFVTGRWRRGTYRVVVAAVHRSHVRSATLAFRVGG
jgi:hypothetical protein